MNKRNSKTDPGSKQPASFRILMVAAVLILGAGLLAACASQPAAPAEPAATSDSSLQATAVPSEMTLPAATATKVPPTVAAQPGTVSFSQDVLPILQSRCVNCHGGERIEEGLVMKSYAELMTGSKNGAVIVPGDTVNSLLAQLIIEQEMPKRGPKLTSVQTQTILDWIIAGAMDN